MSFIIHINGKLICVYSPAFLHSSFVLHNIHNPTSSQTLNRRKRTSKDIRGSFNRKNISNHVLCNLRTGPRR